MDIDKLKQLLPKLRCEDGFSSLMDIDKLKLISGCGIRMNSFSSLMDIDKLKLLKESHIPEKVLVH